MQHAHHKPLEGLTSALGDLDRSEPAAVCCKGVYRSAIAASLLQRAGFQQRMNVTGGFDAWNACHLPLVTGEPVATT